MEDLTKRRDVVKRMSSSKTEQEWDRNCEAVKKANGGIYPCLWYEAVMLTNLHGKIQSADRSDFQIAAMRQQKA